MHEEEHEGFFDWKKKPPSREGTKKDTKDFLFIAVRMNAEYCLSLSLDTAGGMNGTDKEDVRVFFDDDDVVVDLFAKYAPSVQVYQSIAPLRWP